jgi:hypothetical protein
MLRYHLELVTRCGSWFVRRTSDPTKHVLPAYPKKFGYDDAMKMAQDMLDEAVGQAQS